MTYDRLKDFSVDGEISSSVQGKLMGTFELMPTASERYKGKTVQYVGPNSLGGYINGAFYKCEETSPGVYIWQMNNPPGGGGSSTVVWTQTKNGLKIASISINGASTDVEIPYATSTEGGIVTSTEKGDIANIPTLASNISSEVTRATGVEGNLANAIALKQDILTASQLAVLGSGITSGKVSSYDSHISSNSNPHNVSKAQIGLGNVDNTSDMNKPISTAQQAEFNNKQNKSLGSSSANFVVVTDASGNIAASTVATTKLAFISGLTSDAQNQLNAKVDAVTGYSLSKITLNGSVTDTPSFYAPSSAGTADTYLFWNNSTKAIEYKNLPAFIQVKGNKTGDELNAMTGATVGDLYVCTVDSTTAPVKYANTAYYWASDNTWAIFCQTTIDLSAYLPKQTTSASVVMVSDTSKNIIASSIGTDKLNYIANVTSDIQTQLNNKQATISGSQLDALNSGITSGKVTSYDNHLSDSNAHVTSTEKSAWNGKQAALVSGTNIKTINGTSLLGSGDITISSGASFTSISGDPRDNTALANYLDGKQNSLTTGQLSAANSGITSSKVTSYDNHLSDSNAHVTSTEKSAWNGKQAALTTDQLAACNSGITATKVSSIETHMSDTGVHVTSSEKSTWNGKQDALVSGTNIKSIGGVSVVGSGEANIIATDWTSTKLPQSASAILSKIKEYGADFKGTVPLVTDLASITGMNVNDWAIVTTDANHGNMTSRYCYTGSAWVWQYSINNMSFTTEQLAAMNSGINSTKVSSYDSHLTNSDIHFTSAERTKLSGIEAEANKTTVDFATSTSSSNPIANKAITEEVNKKLDKNTAITAGTKCKITYDANGLVTNGEDIDASDVKKMTSYTIGGSYTAIVVGDSLNQAVGKLEYALNNPGATSKMTSYAIATSSAPILATDTLNQAIAKLEYRLKELEDAKLVRYGEVPFITVTAPTEGQSIAASSVAVSGTVNTDATSVTAKVNGGTATALTLASGAFSGTLALPVVGLNTIVFTNGPITKTVKITRTA